MRGKHAGFGLVRFAVILLVAAFMPSSGEAGYEVLWHEIQEAVIPSSASSVGDPDGDGMLEFVGVSFDDHLFVRNALTGALEDDIFPLPGSGGGAVLMNLDGDSRPEIVIVGSGAVTVLAYTETSSARSPGADSQTLEPLRSQPNPFNPQAEIVFNLDAPGRVRLQVYDASGRVVRRLVDGPYDGGQHKIVWDGSDTSGREVASGTYFYELRVNGQTVATDKAVLLK